MNQTSSLLNEIIDLDRQSETAMTELGKTISSEVKLFKFGNCKYKGLACSLGKLQHNQEIISKLESLLKLSELCFQANSFVFPICVLRDMEKPCIRELETESEKPLHNPFCVLGKFQGLIYFPTGIEHELLIKKLNQGIASGKKNNVTSALTQYIGFNKDMIKTCDELISLIKAELENKQPPLETDKDQMEFRFYPVPLETTI